MFIHERQDWPSFRWNETLISNLLTYVRHRQGVLLGRIQSLGFDMQSRESLKALTADAVNTSAIEGEMLQYQSVRSSLATRLGIDIGGLLPADRNVDGIVDVILDATQQWSMPLTKERLFGWHGALFPTGRSGLLRIDVAQWRRDLAGPMQVVSGPFGRERVHFEAPAANKLDAEMDQFLDWFESENGIDLVLKAAIAHFWFVTIHPFDDGNGRIGRALADLLLARSERTAYRSYSMSSQIRIERTAYYQQLENGQKGELDITDCLIWFLHCLGNAIDSAAGSLDDVVAKSLFWSDLKGVSLNERQRAVLNLILSQFEGNLTTSKWAKLTKCSQDTALRDIEDLMSKSILRKGDGGGRSTNYVLF